MSDNKSKTNSTVVVCKGLASGGSGFVGGGVHHIVAGSAAFGNGAGPGMNEVSQHMGGLQAKALAAEQQRKELVVLLAKAGKVISQFMPNAAKCFGIDFQLLNDTACDIQRVLDAEADQYETPNS
jgi:hypothetical protein